MKRQSKGIKKYSKGIGHRTIGIIHKIHELDFDMLMKQTQNRSKKHVQNGPCPCQNRQVSGPFGYNLPSNAIRDRNFAIQTSAPKRGKNIETRG